MHTEVSPRLSVIITTHTSVPYLTLCLDSIGWHREACEVVVYGDGSPSATIELLRKYPWVRSRCEPDNVGIPDAGNRAAAMANGEYMYFVNDDMVFPPQFEQLLLKEASPRRVISATCVEPPIPGFRSAKCFVVHDCGMRHDDFNREKFESFVSGHAQTVVEPGVNYPFLISRALFDEVQGFDTRFREGPLHDPDFFYRLKIAGAELIRRRDLLMYHFSGRSLRFHHDKLLVSAQWRQAEFRCICEFIRKWGERPRCSFGQVPRTTRKAPLSQPPSALERCIIAAKLARARVREWQRRKYRWSLPKDSTGN